MARARQKRLRENMEGHFLGPMDPTEFMDAFMPVNSGIGGIPDDIDFREVYDRRCEKEMYEPFVRDSVAVSDGSR